MVDTVAHQLLEAGNKLFERGSLLSFWQEVADNFYPERTDFTRTLYLGRELTDHLMESYPVIARRELGNALSTMLRPRAKTWFHPHTGREEIDEDPEVKRWLEYAGRVLYRAIYDPRAQFVRATKQCDHDYVAFGNGVISVEEGPSRDHLLYRNWHLRDCAWAPDGCGVIDTLHRKMEMSTRNMVAKWGDKVHQTIRNTLDKEPEKKHKLRHIAMPAEQYVSMGGGSAPKKGSAWAHVYVDEENAVVLQETWRNEFGYVVPRWHLISGFDYGFSAATTIALPDARMLQQIARVISENAEKAVDPPLIATMEAVRSDINIFAGGVTWVDKEYDEKLGPAIRPLEINGDVRLGVEIRQDVRNIIAEAFYLNKLLVPNTGDMTATEVQVRVEEFIRGALPVFEPVEVEYNAPLLDVTFQMCMRNGAFKYEDIPQAIRGRDISFVFDSPIQTTEKTLKVAAYQQSLAIITAGSQLDQTVASVLDIHKAAVDAIDGAGAPADWMTSEDDQQAAKDKAQQISNLTGMAQALSAGAQVGGQVADTAQKMQGAGLV